MMRGKTVTRLLALTMLLMMLSLPALAEGCALCGEETGSDAYLCPACMLELLTDKKASALDITGAVVNADGSVTLGWQDEANNGPYQVYYQLLEAAPVPFGWTAAQNVHDHAVTLKQLAPEVSYVFTVTDASGYRAEYVYCPTTPENGNEIGAKIRIHTKLRNEEMVLEYPFSASEIMLDNGKEHGLYMKLAYSMLRKTRNYAFTVTVEAPCGFKDVVLDGTMTLNRGKSEVPAWGFISLDAYFSYLERYYGGVPTGEYLVTMNFDGKPAHTVSFMVKE
ncbi:MAG: hypothetical protein PUC00_10595 [Clostridiales bacterium]|nr:hypothetical protein [Clostridiales bacterium]